MTNKPLKLFAASMLAVAIGIAGTALAQTNPSAPGASTGSTEQTKTDRAQSMTAMMDRCHRMMGSMHRTPSTPGTK
jgi:hypothetical protein